MIDFRKLFENKRTPLDVPVLTTFFVRDKLFVVDVEGTLFFVDVDSDDVDQWYWQVVQEL